MVGQTSIGSSTARSTSSIPRFVNLAILASVPASTMTFVSMLCAWRLYKGMIMRLLDEVDVVEAVEEMDVVDM